MSTRVYLLRHAESAQPNVFHGAESDVGLSPRGLRQAEAAAAYLAQRQPQAIVSSAMLRARQTALPIARACGLELRLEPELHERKVGILSHQPFDSYDQLWARTLDRWLAGDVTFAPAGAESFADLQARILPVWDRLIQEHAGRSLVLVVHGVVIKVLLVSLLEGHGLQDWKKLGHTENVGITELVPAGDRWRAEVFNHVPVNATP